MPEHGASTAWKRFWERGGWWKGVMLAAVYYGLYQLGGLGITALAAPMLTDPNIFLHTAFPGEGPLASIANLGNLPVIIFGLIAIIFIRGRVTQSDGLNIENPVLG